eukprot:TRINITY_DN7846_c0_g1_i1.p1 TRINITY_DN7846_c0_g1~~TRINITY_DN7846_c0_g1_i1.p1  ORF type:complete len:312 (-),score=46.73 TRINITY_DN7846_c0_g1_i1:6-941(-)
MDIHDGNTFYWKGIYYYYGASYGLCEEPSGQNGCADFGFGNCGFQFNHNVSLYTSPDLATWTFKGHIFQFQDFPIKGVMFCPKVLYNARNNNFVLWFNWIDLAGGWSASYYAVAVSPNPEGPFKIVSKNVTTLAFADTGDFSLFLDDDNSAYIIYTSHIANSAITHRMSVEKLTDDFTASLGTSYNSGFFGQSPVEAPAMFKKDDIYYSVFGSTCCFCGEGAPVNVYVSNHPLGPYTQTINLGSQIPSQQTSVLRYKQADGSWGFLWQGDRWQSAPDHIKGHDFSYWGPLQFDSKGNVKPLIWENAFTLEL